MAAAVTTTAPRILLLGGHGKVSMHLTPLLLAKSWDVVSVVRNSAHRDEILSLGQNQPGKVEVVVDSLDHVKEESHAKKIIDQVKPKYVVWSAGAGGKGGKERTDAVDRVAAKAYISASISTSTVTKFLMISYIASRRGYPSWWNDEDKSAADKVNTEVLPAYYQAKVDADEHLAALARKRGKGFQAINLRPGTLTDDKATGKIWLGKTSARGKISREDVARVAAALLERDDVNGWYDLLEGDDDIDAAVDRLAKQGWDAMQDGEDLERIYGLAAAK